MVDTPDIQHVRWAIDQRAKIQHTLLALYERVKEQQKLPPDYRADILLEHLIASAFCLWRAVFLADRERTPTSAREAQLKFLAKVINTNAITFSDDQANSAWSVTFYLENAKQRIMAAQQFLFHREGPTDQTNLDFAAIIRLIRLRGPEPAHMRYEWSAAHLALRMIYNSLFDDFLQEEEPSISPSRK